MFGNTQQVAEAIAGGFTVADTKLLNVSEATPADLKEINLLIVGSPTHGGRAKPTTLEFLNQIPAGALAGIGVAAFDTRFAEKRQNFALRMLMKMINFAAPKIAKTLVSKGGKLVAPPEGFFVLGSKGPLQEGELERAAVWAKNLIMNIQNNK
jgi:flavodoxin